MAQGNTQVPTTGPVTPAVFAGDINAALLAQLTQNSGNSAPANGPGAAPVLGQMWMDTSASIYSVKWYDGAVWVVIGTLDPTTHVFTPGTLAAFGTQTNIAAVSTTVDLGSVATHLANVTGTPTIASWGNSANTNNPIYITKMAGAATITASANILFPVASYVCAAGDMFFWKFEGAGVWRLASYALANGQALVQPTFTGSVKIAGGGVNQPGSTASLVVNLTGWQSQYRQVDIYFDGISGLSGGSEMRMRMRDGSGDITSASYAWAYDSVDWSAGRSADGSGGAAATYGVIIPAQLGDFTGQIKCTLSNPSNGFGGRYGAGLIYDGLFHANTGGKLRRIYGSMWCTGGSGDNCGLDLFNSTGNMDGHWTAMGIPI